MATKSYFVGPQDGWVKVTNVAAKAVVQIGAYPHTHPFYVFGDATVTPTDATVIGVLTCHHPFHIENSNATGNVDVFWVRVKNPGNALTGHSGQVRIDVYVDGGTLP